MIKHAWMNVTQILNTWKPFFLCRELPQLPDAVHKLHLAPQGLYQLMYNYGDLFPKSTRPETVLVPENTWSLSLTTHIYFDLTVKVEIQILKLNIYSAVGCSRAWELQSHSAASVAVDFQAASEENRARKCVWTYWFSVFGFTRSPVASDSESLRIRHQKCWALLHYPTAVAQSTILTRESSENRRYGRAIRKM